MKPFLPFLLLVGITACRNIEYTPFAGEQRDWPLGEPAFVKTTDGIPIYHGPPPREYTVLGRTVDDDVGERDLVRLAHKQAADAIVILSEERYGRGTIHEDGVTLRGNNWSYTTPSKTKPDIHKTTFALLIRWRQPQSIAKP